MITALWRVKTAALQFNPFCSLCSLRYIIPFLISLFFDSIFDGFTSRIGWGKIFNRSPLNFQGFYLDVVQVVWGHNVLTFWFNFYSPSKLEDKRESKLLSSAVRRAEIRRPVRLPVTSRCYFRFGQRCRQRLRKNERCQNSITIMSIRKSWCHHFPFLVQCQQKLDFFLSISNKTISCELGNLRAIFLLAFYAYWSI